MPYSEDLIHHAILLSNIPGDPKQVDLRRAVSAAYYSLFHLLTTEAAQNWKHPNQRDRFARLFEHRRIKESASRFSSSPLPQDSARIPIAKDLKFVANSFVQLQRERQTADYDNSEFWSRSEVRDLIASAQDAISAWSRIRETEMAQEFSIGLAGRQIVKRGAPSGW